MQVAEKGNLLVVATVLRDRAYLMTMKSTNSLAWRKNKDDMCAIRCGAGRQRARECTAVDGPSAWWVIRSSRRRGCSTPASRNAEF
jgi:hypothetical protein